MTQSAYGGAMARVRSVGGIAAINHLPADSAGGDSVIDLHVRLFALLDEGRLAFDQEPLSMSIGVPSDETHTLPDRVARSLGVGVGGLLPPELRQAQWGRLVEILDQEFGISIDAETLAALPFNLLSDGELSDLLGAQS
jgi:hypothetical protein